jgi:cyanate permease
MFLFGLLSIPMMFTTHKAAGEWFSGKQLGMANAILAMGMGIGNTVGAMISATVLSPLLGGWRNVMFAYGAIAVIICFLWLTARSRPGPTETSQPASMVPFREALSHVIRIKPVWLLALFKLCINSYVCGFMGYLPLYLRGIGWPDVSADGALATLAAASVIGVIPLSVLSDRIGLRKIVLYLVVAMIIIGVSLLSIFGGSATWVAVVMVGLVQESFFALAITMIMETRGIGATYAGTALGLGTTMSGLGGFFGPPIGNRLAEINPRFGFAFWAAMAAAGLVVFRFVEETGWKKRGTENTLDGHAI